MLDKRYDHKLVEEGRYDKWLEEGYFSLHDLTKTPFSLVIPPPNITGKLHLGHAWNTTLQDIIARYKKMKGYDVLWLPGMDHAGIATQARVMAELRKQGIDTKKLTREQFLKYAWEHKDTFSKTIHEQWKMMGLALDYTHERFTLDEGLSKAVNEVFVKYYNEGLIYKDKRIINWDPVQMTALSNIEVIHKDEEGDFFYFAYPIVGSEEKLIIATTRPETMFADVAIVVNPNDERYKKYVGMKAINPANDEPLIIIADDYVDKEFGTGVMKCTPAHDPNDFLIGQKYHLPMPECMNKDATMNELAKGYVGLDRYACRKKLVEDIKNKGLLVKIEKIVHAVGHSERSDAVVEPMLSSQWFVRMKPLAEKALAMTKKEEHVEFIPSRFEQVFIRWMENLEDWCISRQLWWGHQIPAYYHKATGDLVVSVNPPKDIENYERDNDVLDTWFSSALWPFATLNWLENSKDYQRYFPTDVLVTAYDIIFFWVSRMIMQSLSLTDKIPFKRVLIHGLVRDEHGKKMSKSAGNGVDPIEVIDKYGVDALRYFLTTISTPGQDIRYSEEKIIASSNYLNKIWNATRYVLTSLEDIKLDDLNFDESLLTSVDCLIIERFNKTLKEVEEAMERYDFNMASTHLYNFVYDDFCSSYLEASKTILRRGEEKVKVNNAKVLLLMVKNIIKMIYPYTPFIAETLYLSLPTHLESINLETYPEEIKIKLDEDLLKEAALVYQSIFAIRSFKAEQRLRPHDELNLEIVAKFHVSNYASLILKDLLHLGEVNVVNEDKLDKNGKNFIFNEAKINLIIKQDEEEISAQISKQLEAIEKEILRSKKMLENPSFLAKAPAELVKKEKEKLASNTAIRDQLVSKLHQ